MSILSEIKDFLSSISIPVETGTFSETAPDVYAVLTPIADTFGYHADNLPEFDIQEVRISLFSKINYQQKKRQIVNGLVNLEFTITDRRYLGYEDDTGYHHYALDVAKQYRLED